MLSVRSGHSPQAKPAPPSVVLLVSVQNIVVLPSSGGKHFPLASRPDWTRSRPLPSGQQESRASGRTALSSYCPSLLVENEETLIRIGHRVRTKHSCDRSSFHSRNLSTNDSWSKRFRPLLSGQNIYRRTLPSGHSGIQSPRHFENLCTLVYMRQALLVRACQMSI